MIRSLGPGLAIPVLVALAWAAGTPVWAGTLKVRPPTANGSRCRPTRSSKLCWRTSREPTRRPRCSAEQDRSGGTTAVPLPDRVRRRGRATETAVCRSRDRQAPGAPALHHRSRLSGPRGWGRVAAQPAAGSRRRRTAPFAPNRIGPDFRLVRRRAARRERWSRSVASGPPYPRRPLRSERARRRMVGRRRPARVFITKDVRIRSRQTEFAALVVHHRGARRSRGAPGIAAPTAPARVMTAEKARSCLRHHLRRTKVVSQRSRVARKMGRP